MLILNGIQWGAAIGLGALSASLPLGLAIAIIKLGFGTNTKKDS